MQRCFQLLRERLRGDHASATCKSTHCFSCCWSDSGRLAAIICAPPGPLKMIRAVGLGFSSAILPFFKVGETGRTFSRTDGSEKSTDKRSTISLPQLFAPHVGGFSVFKKFQKKVGFPSSRKCA